MHVMRATLALVILVAAAGATARADGWKDRLPPADRIPQYLQDISVTIKAAGSEGSGVVKTREVEGTTVNWVWTAAHVVRGLRQVKEIIATDGTKRQVVKFDDPQIVKELVENGRRVGELKMDAVVVRYSEKEDLALLRIRKTNFVQASVVFYQDQAIPPIGSQLYHCGSLLGQMGSNSMTSGIVSQIGRVLDQIEYDQTTVTAFPGSSGGGVYLQDGAYIGMLVRGAGEGFNLIVPMRRIEGWAKSAGIEWAIDDTVKMPSEEELEKLPIEDTGVHFETRETKNFPTLIRRNHGEETEHQGGRAERIEGPEAGEGREGENSRPAVVHRRGLAAPGGPDRLD